MLTINVVTLFPEVFGGALGASILGRAAQLGLARYRVVQLRDYAHDRHRTVDDSPYGGGAGMVLKPEPFFEAGGGPGAPPPHRPLPAAGRAVPPPGAGRVFGGPGAPPAVRPLQDGGPPGGGRCASSTRWCGCFRGPWATTSRPRRTRTTTGCCRRRVTPGRPAIADWMSRRYC